MAKRKGPSERNWRAVGKVIKSLKRKALEREKTWAVYVDAHTYGKRTTYKTFFRVGVQYFILAETDDPDEGERHCKRMGKMFLTALENIGVRINTRKRR